MASVLKLVSSSKCFGGQQNVYSFFSRELQSETKFSAYLPPGVSPTNRMPALYWLSGLTCTEENFIIKSGFQRYASDRKLVVIGPDTSPRGCNIPGEEDDWDFGTGAGFYVDATTEGYGKHYRMFSYVSKELPEVVERELPVIVGHKSVAGHSMGGHGALVVSLKNPGAYQSVSAFAPISNPVASPWGIKCFRGYLGDDQEAWKEYDAKELIARGYKGPDLHLRIDQGTQDPYIEKDLIPNNFVVEAKKQGLPLDYRFQEGYDHGYFFVSSFIGEHIDLHAKILYQNLP